MEYYWIINLISSFIGLYARYIVVRKFYGVNNGRKILDMALFLSFYLLVNLTYFAFEIPIITLLANIILLGAIALTYERKILKAVFIVMIINFINVAVESVVYILTMNIYNRSFSTPTEYNSITGIVIMNIVLYLLARIYSSVANSRKNDNMFIKSFWIAIILVPFSTFYFMYSTFINANLSDLNLVTVSVMVIAVNFIVFAIYEELNSYYEVKNREQLSNQLNISYSKQLDMMKRHIENRRAMQHDFKQHLYSIRSYIKADRYDEAEAYLSEIEGRSNMFDHGIKTNNMIIDSIVNFELGEIDTQEVAFISEISQLPEHLGIKDYDLTVIFSNLIRNAVEGIKGAENKVLKVTISYDKGLLFFGIENTFSGDLLLDGSKIATIKPDKENHGFGLKNVNAVIEHYHGSLELNYLDHYFVARAILYTAE